MMDDNGVSIAVISGGIGRLSAALAAANKTRFHLPDGPEQAARDAKMAAGGTDWSIKTIGWLYGHDAAAVVETGNLGLPPAV